MYEELERNEDGTFTGEQLERLMNVEDATQHFRDLLNVYPLFEERIEQFKKVLTEAKWPMTAILKAFYEASNKTLWTSDRIVRSKMQRLDCGTYELNPMKSRQF